MNPTQNHFCKNPLNNQSVTFAKWFQLKALRNALKTGHCAPTVMRTLRELQGADIEPMVKSKTAIWGC